MTTALITEQSFSPVFAAIDRMETAFGCHPQECEDSLQFLCMRWTTGCPECKGQARCEVQAVSR